MLNLHFSKRVNRQPEVRDKITAALRSSQFKAWIIRKWLYVVLCFIFVSSISWAAVPQAVHADKKDYLLDRVITWADGSTERVQIDSNYWFYLEGVRKKLVGMTFQACNPLNTGREWDYTLAENRAFFEKQLAYLKSIGVRIVRATAGNRFPSPWEATDYRNYLDLFKRYKMLVIFSIPARDWAGFNKAMKAHKMSDLVVEYASPDTYGKWLDRLLPVIANYDNIVAFSCDNELDYLAPGMDYTASDVTAYLTWLTGRIKKETPFLTTHNLCADNTQPAIKAAVLAKVDVPSFDWLGKDIASLKSHFSTYIPRLGVTGNWWCMEVGYCDESVNWVFNANLVTADFIDAAFKEKATMAAIPFNIHPSDDGQQYFDRYGNPKANLVKIAQEIPRLQAAINDPVARMVASSSPLNTASNINSSFTNNSNTAGVSLKGINVSLQWPSRSSQNSQTATKPTRVPVRW